MPSSPFRVRHIERNLRATRFTPFGDMPRTIRPTGDAPFRLSHIEKDDNITIYRRGLSFSRNKQEELEKRAVSESVVRGSVHERIIYKELKRRSIRFDFQSRQLGGRQQLGGLVADFILPEYGKRGVIINPLGTIWHKGLFNERRDEQNNALLQLLGYTTLSLWDWEVEDNTLLQEWFRRYIDFMPRHQNTARPFY